MNEYQQKRIVDRVLSKSFNTLTNKKVCVLGYAFKADTGDTRETPAKAVIDYLKAERTREIAVYDPKAGQNAAKEVSTGCYESVLYRWSKCVVYNDPYIAAANADILIVCTDWGEFKEYDWSKIYRCMANQKLVYDARNYLDHKMLRDIGFDVMAVGKA